MLTAGEGLEEVTEIVSESLVGEQVEVEVLVQDTGVEELQGVGKDFCSEAGKKRDSLWTATISSTKGFALYWANFSPLPFFL